MIKKMVLKLITMYQLLISPFLGPNCRFQPSCSEYTRQAINAHGALKGIWFGFCRIIRCHPFHPGGYDPVPTVKRSELDNG